MDSKKVAKLAKHLINYSVELEKGENILIETFDGEDELVNTLIEEVHYVGGNAFLSVKSNKILRKLLLNGTEEQIERMAKIECDRMDQMDAYIGIEGVNNKFELSDVPIKKICSYLKLYNYPLHWKRRIPNTKWCQLSYPSTSYAQQAGMSREAFENLYFDICLLEYERMSLAMDKLVDYMDRTDKVRIVAEDTDLTFSIKGYPARKCIGKKNIPDGEVYVAPVIDSANGYITFNFPSDYSGVELGDIFENVRLEFKNGRIVEARSNNNEKINTLLDIDENARFLGEFAIGINPFINIDRPVTYILIDEAISGSLHIAAGESYAASDNGNRSALHWDFIQMHTPEYGGGELWFDDVLVRKDGIFVVKELKCLNPDNFK